MEEKSDAKLHSDAEELKSQDAGQAAGAPSDRGEPGSGPSASVSPDSAPSGDSDGAVPVPAPKKRGKDRTGEEEARRMNQIRTLASVVLIIVLAFFAFKGYNSDEGFRISIPTKDGFEWRLEASDPAYVTVDSAAMEDGHFVCRLTGVAEGETGVDVIRYAVSAPDTPVETRTYHLRVLEDMHILQLSVEREILED